MYVLQRIDPAESDAESEKLRMLLYKLEQSACSKYNNVHVEDGSLYIIFKRAIPPAAFT